MGAVQYATSDCRGAVKEPEETVKRGRSNDVLSEAVVSGR